MTSSLGGGVSKSFQGVTLKREKQVNCPKKDDKGVKNGPKKMTSFVNAPLVVKKLRKL